MNTLRIQSVIDRLKADLTGFRDIDGAAGYSTARKMIRAFPAAYALPLQDKPGPNRYGGCKVGQQVDAEFAVILIARDVAADGGVCALTELEDARGQLHASVLGWQPDPGFEAVTYRGGMLISEVGKDGLVVWQNTYATAFQLEDTR